VHHKLTSYCSFLFKSKNEYGVHSPFIFNLITKGLNARIPNAHFALFSSYKKELLKNPFSIKVTDYGAGSKVFSSASRKISRIARYVGISNKKAILLMNLMQYFKPRHILEIGTSLGISTAAMAISNRTSTIISLEGCQETGNIAKNMFKKYCLNNIKLVIENFKTSLIKESKNKTFDFIYFDGNHTKEATLKYFKLIASSVKNDSVLVVDDIHWSKGMEEAWNDIKDHSKVTVTMDMYYWGIVFFRKEQQKEHFTIRI